MKQLALDFQPKQRDVSPRELPRSFAEITPLRDDRCRLCCFEPGTPDPDCDWCHGIGVIDINRVAQRLSGE